MSNAMTADKGIESAIREIKSRGAVEVFVRKEGRKRFIDVLSPNNRRYIVAVRSKRTGTWQTTIEYGKPQRENLQENEFWLFVDLGFDPPKFYLTPFWWISNNIHETHKAYLEKNNGRRVYNCQVSPVCIRV